VERRHDALGYVEAFWRLDAHRGFVSRVNAHALLAGVSWKQSIYEDNEATGASTTAMGSNYPQYAHGDGAPHIQNIYHHNNSQNMVWYVPYWNSNNHTASPTLAIESHLAGSSC
jgi:hypothetical protein